MRFWNDVRPTVLLTGFGPFPGVRRNASGTLASWLALHARLAIPNVRTATAVLPTDWVRAPRLLAELHARHDPVLSLHFGVASNMKGLRIEAEAHNFCRMSADAAGNLPALGQLIESGAPALPATIDANGIAQHLGAKGFHATLSDDAGGYLCNAVLYHSLLAARQNGGRCKVGFVHIPTETTMRDILVTVAPGALEILRSALQTSRQPTLLTSA